MLKCRDLVNQADLLLDDAEMSSRQRFSLRAHLLICHHCRRYVHQLRELRAHLLSREAPRADDVQVKSILECIDRQT